MSVKFYYKDEIHRIAKLPALFQDFLDKISALYQLQEPFAILVLAKKKFVSYLTDEENYYKIAEYQESGGKLKKLQFGVLTESEMDEEARGLGILFDPNTDAQLTESILHSIRPKEEKSIFLSDEDAADTIPILRALCERKRSGIANTGILAEGARKEKSVRAKAVFSLFNRKSAAIQPAEETLQLP